MLIVADFVMYLSGGHRAEANVGVCEVGAQLKRATTRRQIANERVSCAIEHLIIADNN